MYVCVCVCVCVCCVYIWLCDCVCVLDYREILIRHEEVLVRTIEPRFGLLNDLKGREVLSPDEYDEIQNIDDVPVKCKILLDLLKQKGEICQFEKFIESLIECKQKHVANYIACNGGKYIYILRWPTLLQLYTKIVSVTNRNDTCLLWIL